MRRRSDYPVWLLLRAATGLVRALPRGLALGVGASAGRLARTLGMRRAVADANLAVAFPDLTEGTRADLARRMYAHFGRMGVDSLRLQNGRDALLKLVENGDAALRVIEAALARRRGVLILTGHVGNWELAGAYLAARGLEVAAVVKPPSNPYVAADADLVRRRLGMETISMDLARGQVIRALAANQAVALVADQGELRSTTWARFFGRPTKTPAGPGLFAARSGAPVVFGSFVALEGGRYRIEVEPLEDGRTGDAREAAQRLADRYRERLEAVVRRYPEQYLWTHRVWRDDLPGPPPDWR